MPITVLEGAVQSGDQESAYADETRSVIASWYCKATECGHFTCSSTNGILISLDTQACQKDWLQNCIVKDFLFATCRLFL